MALNQRNPSTRVSGVLREVYTKEYRTAARWEERYASTWRTLNPFETPARSRSELPPLSSTPSPNRHLMMSSPTQSSSSSSPTLPPASPSPNRTHHEQSSTPNPISASALLQQTKRTASASASPSVSPPRGRTTHSAKRNYNHLKYADARKEFYDKFIAKPQYPSSMVF